MSDATDNRIYREAPMKVYKAINAVQKALSQTGISKDKKNSQGAGYMFRGIDDVYNAIAPLLAEHGLCIVPRFLNRTCDERQSKSGGALFYVTVEAEFDFISSEDGSKHTARTFGEAMDSGDKATNKAMSAAYKYAAFQTFAIPTEAHPDADAETHQPVARQRTGVAQDVLATSPAMTPVQVVHIGNLCANMLKDFEAYGPQAAYERMDEQGLEAEEKIYLSTLMPSHIRNAITKYSRELNTKKD